MKCSFESSREALQKRLPYYFRHAYLLNEALDHSRTLTFQRLEFLGDRALSLIIARHLYEKFPTEEEGGLAKRFVVLVQRAALQEIALFWQLDQCVRHRIPVEKHNRVLSDACEALIGALFMDAGLEKTQTIVLSAWMKSASYQRACQDSLPSDPKTQLQEYLQSEKKNLPRYVIRDCQGPSHQPTFLIELFLDSLPPIQAEGKSRREAEQRAAKKALTQFGLD